jgi:hypothetical protein
MGEQQRRQALRRDAAPTASLEHSRALWVIAVLAFWVSAAINIAMLAVTGKLDLILGSVTIGMMVLGVWLKTRYQLQQRKARHRADGDGSS